MFVYRTLLLDVVRNKVEAELVNKNRTVSGEEVIMVAFTCCRILQLLFYLLFVFQDFLQTVIKPLWPVGWFVKKLVS